MKKLAIVVLLTLTSFTPWFSKAAELAPNHPEFHVVQPGDTLWDISQAFLQSPWLWPEIWHVNEQVDNPHLIFPGDIIALVYVDGKPRIMKTNRYPSDVVKLSPKARELDPDLAIATLPLDAILPFLSSAQVVSQDEYDNSPYVVGSDSGRLLSAENNKVYVRGILDSAAERYSFFRKGDDYIDPITKEHLGIEAIHVAEGLKKVDGDPAVVLLKSSVQELLVGDKAWASNDDQLRPTYFPKAPENFAGGQIISVYNGVQQIGQYNVVVINRGKRENMEVGHVLSIFQAGKTIRDKVASKRSGDDEYVTLPDELAGRLMIFRTFEKVSLGLVLKASRPIHINDKVKTPI